MSLELWFEPLGISSQVAALGLLECGADFCAHDLQRVPESERQAFIKIWPSAQLPVLIDKTWDELLFGGVVIAEYATVYRGSPSQLLSAEACEAFETRRWGRLIGNGVAWPMFHFSHKKLGLPGEAQVGDLEIQRARRLLVETLPVLEERLNGALWIMGRDFSLADCVGGPSLLACEAQQELDDYPNLRAYLDRCWQRPAFLQMLRLVGDQFLRYSEYPAEGNARLVLSPPVLQRMREARVISPREKLRRPGE